MTFSPAPKPQKAPKSRPKWLPRSTKPIARSPLKSSRKPVKQRNERRIKRKAVAYRKVIASDFHKQLRYKAWERSLGYCECERCVNNRATYRRRDAWNLAWRVQATPVVQIPIWFTKSGGEPWKRFRSTEGELHHLTYKFFGDENPAELEHVRWMWKSCHQRVEAQHDTRRRFLKSSHSRADAAPTHD